MLRPVFFAALVIVAAPAGAWQIEDPIHSNCHERITQGALTKAGYAGTPPAPTEDELLLLDSAQFDLAQYDQNPWAWALLIGVRYPDLKGAPSFDFDDLSRVHNALDAQDEHCLRSELEDSAEGDARALAACRDVISSMYWEALTSLDVNGDVDPNVQTFAAENLTFSGRSDVPVSQFYFAAGKGLHAIQDGFTHTHRDPEDFRAIHTIFNWSDQVSCAIDEERDGHGHESLLDDCDGTHESNAARFEATEEASAQFLAALSEPGDRAAREQRLQAFLDEWFTLRVGCDFGNGYCAHPEQTFLASSPESDNAICESCASTSASSGAWWLGLAAVGLFARRRRVHASLLFVFALASPVLAQGETDEPTTATTVAPEAPAELVPSPAPSPPPSSAPATPEAAPANSVAPALAPSPKEGGYRTEVRASMSVQNPGTAIGVGAGYRWLRFDGGAFLELNPWFSVEKSRLSLGSTNLGAFFHYLHPISPEADLRFGAGAGAAILNESLAGSPAGKIGPYLNLRLLGVVWHWQDVAMTIDGFDLAVAAPQMVGWPVIYAQHRVSVGLQF